jgi:chromosome segregation ATPase
MTHHTEINRYEERVRSLQKQVSSLENQVNELGENYRKAEDKAYQVAADNNQLREVIQQDKESYQKEILRLSLNHEAQISSLSEDHQRILKNTISSLETEKLKELNSLKITLEGEHKKQLDQKNAIVESLREEIVRKNSQVENLNDELKNLNDRLILAHQELDNVKDHFADETHKFKNEIVRLNQRHETKLQEEVERTQKMLNTHHESKISELERALKKQKEQILSLEQDLQYQGGEKDMLARQLAEVSKEKDEWRSKFQDVKANLEKRIEQLTFESMRIVSTSNDEITRLNIKIDSLNTLLNSSESQNEHIIARLQDECEMLK